MGSRSPAPAPGRLEGNSAAALIVRMCAAHVASMLGFSTWPTLVPALQPLWHLSSGEAGLVSGMFFAGYMVLVPFLSGLTDRMDARRIYVLSCLLASAGSLGFALFADGLWSALVFQFLNGAGIAGTYMPGLKLLTDHTEGRMQSRSVSIYTAIFGVGASLSILLAGGVQAQWGWEGAFAASALGPAVAAWLVQAGMPAGRVHAPVAGARMGSVMRLREVLASPGRRYILGYAVHCWELFGSRSWLVAFLAVLAGGASGQRDAVMIAAAANLLAPLASIAGNEIALRAGRDRLIWNAMGACALLTASLGWLAGADWPVICALAMTHVFLLMGDSGSLTAGMVAASAPPLRGLSMAVHSTLGFGAGFVAPLAFGLVLDASGGPAAPDAWGYAFLVLALPPLAGSCWLRPARNGA